MNEGYTPAGAAGTANAKATKRQYRKRNGRMPAIIGLLDEEGLANKCLVAVIDDGRAKVAVCQLKDGHGKEPGVQVENDDIAYVVQEIWFCTGASLRRYLDGLEAVYQQFVGNETGQLRQ